MSTRWRRGGSGICRTRESERERERKAAHYPRGRLHVNVALCRLLHKECNMATNLALDPFLLDRVVAVSGESTKKAAVTLALKEFIARR